MKSPWTLLVSRLFLGSAEITSTDPNAEECPRFRVLVAGRGESGKLSLVDAVFETSLEDVFRDQGGEVDKNQEIVPHQNERLAIRNFDLGSAEKFRILKKALEEWNQKKAVAERLHAVWLCVATPSTPSSGDPIITFDEKIFKFNRKVPIIVVFTKLDVFTERLGEQGTQNGISSQDLAETEIRKRYGQVLDALTKVIKNVAGQKRYTLVATSQPKTLQDLVDITMKGIGKDMSHPAQIALAAAQRVDKQIKVAASIKVGERIWNAIASDEHFLDVNLEKRLRTIHKHVVTIWNIRDLNEFLLSDAFRSQMMSIMKDHDPPVNSSTTQRHCLLKYFINLVLILQAAFQISFEGQFKQKLTPDIVNEIICEFVCSEREGPIHNAIITWVGGQDGNQILPTSNSMTDEIRSLICRNEIKNDDPISQTKPPLPSLLAILRIALTPWNAINRITLSFMNKLLDSQDYLNVISELATAADVQLFLNFTLCLLHNGSLENCGIPRANHKARKIMEELSEKDALPKVLFISDVKIDVSAKVSASGFGSVLKGTHEGQPVTLKVIYRVVGTDVSTKGSLSKVFCRKALAWWSLSHKSIHPFLGIYEENSWLYLVSPYMMSETLTEWRRNRQPGRVDVRRLMLQVAQGLQYVHSEGIVHGNLSAANVLVDSEFHCHITDFGLTRQIASALSSSTMTDSINYAAPELVGMCSKCLLFECDGCPGHIKGETTQTDVYAYGRLYYAVFFDAIPFEGVNPNKISFLLSSGKQPLRRDSPRMDDDTWDLVEHCWFRNPSERPTMEQIVASHMPRPESLIASLKAELTVLGGSMVNEHTIDRMRELLALSDLDDFISRLVTSDVELLLDFILQLLSNHCLATLGSQDENRKARNLMLKLISTTSDIPKPLYITGVTTSEGHFGAIGLGSLGRNFIGKYEEEDVVLKVVNKGCKDGPLRQDFCRETLAWRSIKHRFILPLKGLFEHESQLYLVSPFVTNGTLCDWRKKRAPAVAEVHRLLLEVAEGVQYIHSEGIVHGNLHTGNILLDSDLHCRITDFGSSRRSETPATQPKTVSASRFAAPELFGVCTGCGISKCAGCDRNKERNNHKTIETESKTDVYAFGCLYYAIFFGTIPFRGTSDFHIVPLVMDGNRPDRLENPKMKDMTWNLLQSCWEPIPSKRPTMEEIVRKLLKA